jgi:hypothetical protein
MRTYIVLHSSGDPLDKSLKPSRVWVEANLKLNVKV